MNIPDAEWARMGALIRQVEHGWINSSDREIAAAVGTLMGMWDGLEITKKIVREVTDDA